MVMVLGGGQYRDLVEVLEPDVTGSTRGKFRVPTKFKYNHG